MMLELVIQLAIIIIPLAGAWIVGSAIERNHRASLDARERQLATRVQAVSLKLGPDDWTPRDPQLVTGSVVISIDHFKRFIAAWRMMFGGPVRSYESLLERARREALLRMQEQAAAIGRNAVVNVRIETARIASAFANGKGTTGVEVLAFGTAVTVPELGGRALTHEAPAHPPWEAPLGAPTATPARPPEPVAR